MFKIRSKSIVNAYNLLIAFLEIYKYYNRNNIIFVIISNTEISHTECTNYGETVYKINPTHFDPY